MTATSNPSPPTHDLGSLPAPARQAAQFLLTMIRIEYLQRQTPIANLSVEEAVLKFRRLFPLYIKGVYPFDIPHRPSDSPRDWWNRVGNNQDTAPLAVFSTPFQINCLLTSYCSSLLRFSSLWSRIPWLMNEQLQPSPG